jgi:hypothetical protein
LTTASTQILLRQHDLAGLVLLLQEEEDRLQHVLDTRPPIGHPPRPQHPGIADQEIDPAEGLHGFESEARLEPKHRISFAKVFDVSVDKSIG